ncbi:MAG: DUF4271 domain-containing protein [Bacteroidota bacterium]|nr:DUF4271 domain-containing protein [Bacteroidota bacterium]
MSVVSDKIIIDNKPENVAGFLSIISRDFSDFNDFFIIGVIIILILIAILYNGNPKYFQEFYSLPKAISLKIREESYLSVKNISGAYLLFLFVHSFLVSFVALTIINYHKGFQQLFYFINTSGIWNASLSWLQLSMIFFALFLAKYLFVKAISLLFNIKGFSTIHFFDFIRMSIIFFLLVLIVLCVFIFSSGSDEYIWFEPLINSIIIFFIFRVFVLFFKLYKYAPFRNLHLFLYICSTELLPLMVGFKILINL